MTNSLILARSAANFLDLMHSKIQTKTEMKH